MSDSPPPSTLRAELAVYGATFLVVLSQGAVIPLLPLVLGEVDPGLAGSAALGIAVAAFGLARLVTNIPTALMADRLGHRLLMVVGAALVGISMLVMAAASSFEAVVLARIGSGVGSGFVIVVSLAYLLGLVPTQRRGTTVGWYRFAFIAGISFGPSIGGLLAGSYGVSAPLILVGISAFLGAILLLGVPGSVQAAARPDIATASRSWVPHRDVLFLLFGVVMFLTFATRWGSQRTLVPISMTEQDVPVEIVGVAFTLGALVTVFAGLATGRLVDRVGSLGPMIGGVALLGLALPGFTLYGLLPASLVVAMMIYGAAEAMIDAGTLTGGSGRAPSGMTARAVAYLRMFGDLGFVVGPIVLGTLAALTSSQAAIVANALILFLAAAMLFVYWRRHDPELAPVSPSSRSPGVTPAPPPDVVESAYPHRDPSG